MATDLTTPLRRFLSALHRRAMIARAAERVAFGSIGGATVGLLLVGMFWWRGGPTLWPAAAAILAGVAGGAAWGVARPPSRLAAAMAADRQWGLDDLLGSAVAALSSFDEAGAPALSDGASAASDGPAPWAATLLAVAAAACRDRSPAAVAVARMGPRVWSGVGLAVALTVTLAALADPSTSLPVADGRMGEADPRSASPVCSPAGRPLVVLASDGKLRRDGSAGPVDEKHAPAGLAEAVAPAKPAPGLPTRPADGTGEGTDPVDPSAGGPAGDGPGFGKTDPERPTRPTPEPATPADPATPAPADSRPVGPPVARGDGPSSPGDPNANAGHAGPAGVGAGAPTAGPPVASPWRAQGWDQDVRAAREQLDAGRVPAAYRDLVRRYFDAR